MLAPEAEFAIAPGVPRLPVQSVDIVTGDGASHPVGALDVDASQCFGYQRGVLWCWRRGLYATVAPKRLSEACRPPNDYGRGIIRRLSKGEPPLKGMSWPLPEGVGPPPGLPIVKERPAFDADDSAIICAAIGAK